MRMVIPQPLHTQLVSEISFMRKQSGLSLIELMIAITLGLILMAGVIQVFLSSRTTFATQQAISRVQETGRLATEFIARDLRMAGYMGCSSRSGAFSDTAGNVLGFHKDFEHGVQGFSSVPAGVQLSPAPTAGSDILVVRSADSAPLLAAGPNQENSFSVKVGSSSIQDDCSNGVCKGSVVAVSDCVDTRVFQVADLVSSGSTTLVVSGVVMPADNFSAGAELVPVKTYVYYVAPSTADPTRPSLWQSVDGKNSHELLEGVERLKLSFGRHNQTNYVPVTPEPDWNEVNSVRIEILVASLDDNVLEDNQHYKFAGADVTATDLRLRQVFINTVAVRSNMQ